MRNLFSSETKTPDLNDIALFARVVEAGGFSAAARALAMPVATVSRRIARLEAALGARLLTRSTRGLTLTPAGLRYLEQTTAALKKFEEAQAAISDQATTVSGLIRATAPVELGARYLVDWFAEFLDEHKRVGIELVLTDESLDLAAERIDIAFRTGPFRKQPGIVRKLAPSRRILAAGSAYLSGREEPRTVEDLAKHECILAGEPLANGRWRLEGPEGERQVDVSGRLSVNNAWAMVRAAAAGLGIGLVPEGLARPLLETGELRQVLSTYSVSGGSFHAHLPSRSYLPKAQQMLLDFVAEKAKSL